MEHRPRFKTVCIRVPQNSVMREIQERVEIGTKTVEKKKGLFGIPTSVEVPVYDDKNFTIREESVRNTVSIDHSEASARLTDACNDLDAEGYEVMQVLPINSGFYDTAKKDKDSKYGAGAWAFGYGYSATTGFVVLAQLKGPHV